MKQKLKPQYVLSLGASAVMVYLLLLIPYSASAASNLTWGADSTIVFTGLANLTLTVKNGSTASSLDVGASSAIVTLGSGQTFTVEDTNNKHITNSAGLTVTTCTGALTRLVVLGPAQVTFNPTSTDPVCASGGSISLNAVSANNNLPAQQPIQQDQKKTEENKYVEQKNPVTPESEKPAVKKPVVKFSDVVKDLQKLAKANRKALKGSENNAFGQAIAGLNANLNALKVSVALKADLTAKPADLVALTTKITAVQTAQAAQVKTEKAAKELAKNLSGFFEGDGKLTQRQVNILRANMKAAGVSGVSVTTKSTSKVVVTIANNTPAKKFVAAKKAATAKALKTLEANLKKLNK